MTECFQSIISRIKAIKLIPIVPPELAEQFDDLQLKNTINRIRIVCMVMIVNTIVTNFPVYLL